MSAIPQPICFTIPNQVTVALGFLAVLGAVLGLALLRLVAIHLGRIADAAEKSVHRGR